jgi:hypothetical protein
VPDRVPAPPTFESQVTLQHERFPDADTADEMKAWWRERVAALGGLIERGGEER